MRGVYIERNVVEISARLEMSTGIIRQILQAENYSFAGDDKLPSLLPLSSSAYRRW